MIPVKIGNLTIFSVTKPPILFYGPEGQYIGDYGPETLSLHCDCGHEWQVPVKDFHKGKGKSATLNCRRDECEYWIMQRSKIGAPKKKSKGPKQERAYIHIWCNKSTVDAIYKLAKDDDLTLCDSINRIVEEWQNLTNGALSD